MITDMTQEALYPLALLGIISNIKYKPGWVFKLEDMDRGQGCSGLTLSIYVPGVDAYHPENSKPVMHMWPVPAAAFNERAWRRWVFDFIVDIETHEAMEWCQIYGERVFAPNHGPGCNPYIIPEYATDEDRRTSFRGELKDV